MYELHDVAAAATGGRRSLEQILLFISTLAAQETFALLSTHMR